MVKLYRAALLRRKPFCLHDRPTILGVSQICLGCLFVLFVTATFHHETFFNVYLSCVLLWETVIGGALQLLGGFYQTLRVERVALKRSQRSVIRES